MQIRRKLTAESSRHSAGFTRWSRRANTAAVFLAGALAACGGGDTGGETAGEPAEGAAATPMVVADAGTIRGMVNFVGDAPANAAIDMSEEQVCAAKHPGGASAEAVVASGGRLANVFIHIKEGLTGDHPAPGGQALIDQVGCVYHPHVIGVQVGQEIAFRNSDGILHNIKAAPTANRTFNISQPTNMTSTRTFTTAEVMVPVQCDVHGWMQMYIGVVAHPYFGVSGADGSFTIANLPPGTYTVEAWHEKYGVQTQQVTVAPNGTADLAFEYSAAMAANAVVPLGEPIDPHDHGPVRTTAVGSPASH